MRVLRLLGYTRNDLWLPGIQAEIAADPSTQSLLEECGSCDEYRDMLSDSFGRRFFRTKQGEFGMTAIEELHSLLHGEKGESRYV